MYEEEIHFGKLLLKQSDKVLENVHPQWPWPLTTWPHILYSSSATQDVCVDPVWRR